jgi:hypothetical protein
LFHGSDKKIKLKINKSVHVCGRLKFVEVFYLNFHP